jgi:hypothetical protein
VKKTLSLEFFWILLIGFSECPTTEVYLETQAGLDNFVANYPNPVSELSQGVYFV